MSAINLSSRSRNALVFMLALACVALCCLGLDDSDPLFPGTNREYRLFALSFFISGLAWCSIGLIVFFRKYNSRAGAAFLFMALTVGVALATLPPYSNGAVGAVKAAASLVAGPSVLILALYYPVEIKQRRLVLAMLAVITIPLVFLNLYLHHTGSQGAPDLLYTLNTSEIAITAGAGLVLMAFSFITSRNPLVKQRSKIVVYGLVLFLLFMLAMILAHVHNSEAALWLLLPGCLLPAALGYSMVKRNLFDVGVFIRKSASYILVGGIALYGIALLLMDRNISQVAAVLSTIVIVMLFRPLRDRIDRAIDRRFFREKDRCFSAIRKAAGGLAGIIELEELLSKILDTVVDAVGIERGMIYFRDRDSGDFPAAAKRNCGEAAAIPAGHPLVELLEARGRAVQLNDLIELEEFQGDREQVIELMHSLRVVLVIPVIYEQRLIGMLALGEKQSGDWYSSEDIELLQTLMIQTAVSIENAGKVGELKKMIELETSYRELKRLDAMKDTFLSMVSHDLRTPMTSIKGYAAIMHEKIETMNEDRQKRYLHIIIQESERLTRLINNLLDLQRFEAGRMKMETAAVDLSALVAEQIEAMRGQAAGRDQVIESAGMDAPLMVRGDRFRLAQVLENLLSNALKFSPPGAVITVAAEPCYREGGPGVRVSVADAGPGIAPDMRAIIFDKFQQVDKLVKDKEQGSGLGLALVRQIVAGHGGEVGVADAPSGGSIFYFILDASQ